MSYNEPPAGGAPYGQPGGQPGGPPAQDTSASGFFGALFDFSFNEFITPKVVKFVYILATIGLALGYLVFLIAGFNQGVLSGLVVLIGGAIAVVIYLALIRMTLEFYLAIVRMSEDVHHRLPGR